jgi:hypothetical protein
VLPQPSSKRLGLPVWQKVNAPPLKIAQNGAVASAPPPGRKSIFLYPAGVDEITRTREPCTVEVYGR